MDLVPTSQYGYSDVPIEQPASLFVPRSAVLMAGRNSVVYVETEPGRFEIRPVVLGPLLRDRVIIIGGLDEGEKVATAGNFLIDSQMQLAGKPSLIDPVRAVAAGRERKEPLDFSDVHIASIAGESGNDLESLFAKYFDIQQSLSSDQKPSEVDVTTLHQLAKILASDPVLLGQARESLAEIAEHSENLHHLELTPARHEAFRPISHAVVKLASLVRGETAHQPFHHMFCPMVTGGAGDWLQATNKLRNPYYGSQMLRCGEIVHEFPARQPQPTDDSSSKTRNADSPTSRERGED
jgi:Cu(I)/Ag(I) efflux system membrane fusion protein